MEAAAVRGSDEAQQLAIRGRVYVADAPDLQQALAQVHDTLERPRCLCVPGGVEMYVARHQRYVAKRMPQTGPQHHPSCPSFAPEDGSSGLGELAGEAVLETQPGHVELRVDFPWTRLGARPRAQAERQEPVDITVPGRRMSLRAVMHYLFERAGFNRWTPAMAGRRHQAQLHKYLMQAAAEVEVKGLRLAERLYVPEAFREEDKAAQAQRRRERLAVLQPRDGQAPLAIVLGEYKSSTPGNHGQRIWVRHMPDVPLWFAERSWARMRRVHAALLEACDADTGHRPRLVLAALVRARRAFTYEIDAATLMLTSAQWIPVDGVHELPLIDALVAQGRRFLKPLRYDAASAAAFPNVLLLDSGAEPVPLHVVSAFLSPQDRLTKDKLLAESDAWVWRAEQPMPPLPAARH